MSLLFADGFDHLGSSDLALKWDGTSGTTTVNATAGRNGKGCFSGTQATLVKNLGTVTDIIMSGAFKFNGSGTGAHFMLLQDGNASSRKVAGLQWATDGTIKIDQPDNSNTVIASGSPVLTVGSWYYIEWKMQIGASITAHSCVVRLNGAVVLDIATGTNTTYISTSVTQGVFGSISGAINSFAMQMDDIVILDLNGSVNNDFLADVTVEAIYPTGSGNYANFSPVGAATHTDCVNEHPQDGDTTYLGSLTPGDRDSFNFGSLLGTPNSIKAVQSVATARKSGPGTRTAASFFRAGATNYDGTTKSLGDNYAMLREITEQNPNTLANWTASNIAAIEAGVKVVA